MTRTVAVLDAFLRPLLAPHLPDWVEPRFFDSHDELLALVPEAEIGWFDSADAVLVQAVERSERLVWLNTYAAGVDFMPLDLLAARGITLTNCAGLNQVTIAEFVLMGMLVVSKGYRDIARAQDRRDWLTDAPGKAELAGSRALVIGAGGIGGRITALLEALGVEVTGVRRRAAPGMLGPGEWRPRLGEFDWVIVVTPSTADTAHMIGAAELAAMKPTATLLNFGRGPLVDTDALVAVLDEQRIGGAFLDVTDPEPLPADHPLWRFDNVHISMHLSGRSQTRLVPRAARRYLENLDRWKHREPLIGEVDLAAGY